MGVRGLPVPRVRCLAAAHRSIGTQEAARRSVSNAGLDHIDQAALLVCAATLSGLLLFLPELDVYSSSRLRTADCGYLLGLWVRPAVTAGGAWLLLLLLPGVPCAGSGRLLCWAMHHYVGAGHWGCT
jgi:hypothetical protein